MPTSDSEGSSPRSSRSGSGGSAKSGSASSPSASHSSASGSRSRSTSPVSSPSSRRSSASAVPKDDAPDLKSDADPEAPSEVPSARGGDQSRDREIHRLKTSNEQLRKKLMQLNSQLDFELAQRGKGHVRHGRVDEHKVAKLRVRVEELRRDNESLKRKVYQTDGVSRVTDLHNQVLQKEQEIEKLKEANRGLENVQRNQSKKMDLVNQIESERDRIRSIHNEELRNLKDRLRCLKETLEKDEKTVKRLQGQINQIEDKIALARGLKSATNLRTLKELEALVAEKEAKIKDLANTIEKLQKQIENERKRAGQRITEKDVEQLRATLQSLKQQLAEKEQLVKKAERTAAPVTADTIEDGSHAGAAATPSIPSSRSRPSKDPRSKQPQREAAEKVPKPRGVQNAKAKPKPKPKAQAETKSKAAATDADSDVGSGGAGDVGSDAGSEAKSQRSPIGSDASSSHGSANDSDNDGNGSDDVGDDDDKADDDDEPNEEGKNVSPDKEAEAAPEAPVVNPVPPASSPQARPNPHNPFGAIRKRRNS